MDSPASTGAQWREGERVRLRGGAWIIATVTPHADCVSLRVSGTGANAGTFRTVLTPFDRPRRLARPDCARLVHPRRWLHALRRAACSAHPLGAVADAPAGGLNLLPYQLEPTLAFLRHGATRVLVADAVGLGKTVQAGLLLHTLAARHPLIRALIVTPAGLREQWVHELAARFGLEATVADAAWLRRSACALPPDVAPWALPGVVITSFDFLKRPEVLRPIEDLTWDVLVVDEAHNATAASARRAGVQAVALRSTRVLLLTATPHAGDTAQFNALCAIGAAPAGEPIVLFRRSRGDVGAGSRRRSVMLAVRPSAAEWRLHRLLDRYTSAICRESRGRVDSRPRLLAVVLKKRALSSAASLGVSVRRRIDLLAGVPQASQLLLPLGDEEPLDDEVGDEALSAPGLNDVRREQQLLKKIAESAEAAWPESKPAFLLRMLRRTGESAIVFTEYRDTLSRLHHLLSAAGHDVTLMHGGQLPAERSAAQRRFNSVGGVLLATDAAAEGLNLHERCRLVVHYELPWTPARLEQRTGRVDRIGQRETVHEVLLVAGHPAERLVLVPLARRAARARSEVGAQSRALDRLAESAVADAVLDRVPLDDPPLDDRAAHESFDLRAEAEAEAARLAEHREWQARSGRSPHLARGDAGVLVTRLRRHWPPSITAVYALSLSSPAGRVEHQELVVTRGLPAGTSTRAASYVSQQRQHAAAVLAHLAPCVHAVGETHARVQRALEERAASLGAQTPSAARALVQAGLFDRRAVLACRDRARAADRLAEGFELDAGAAAEVVALRPALELVAILLA